MVDELKCLKCDNYRVYYDVTKIGTDVYCPTFEQDRRCIHEESLKRQTFLSIKSPLIKGLRLNELIKCPMKGGKNE